MNNTINQDAIYQLLANHHQIHFSQVKAFAKLFDEGASIPFIARYRKEQTGGLDDVILRRLEKSLVSERDLAAYRQKISELLNNQHALTDALTQRIAQASSKLELDDIYRPYRPSRHSVANSAKLAGLEPIALEILSGKDPKDALANFVCPDTLTDETGKSFVANFHEYNKQLAGVQAIIVEIWTQALALFDSLRMGFAQTATLRCELANEEKRSEGEKFKDYFAHSEPFATLSNHRLLAMLRGRQQGVLLLHIDGEDAPFIDKIHQHFHLANTGFLSDCANKLWSKWRSQIEHRLLTERRMHAETEAIAVFAQNLKHLLMAAPAGRKVILGIDPGFKHGIKMAVIDGTGEVLATSTAYPFGSDGQRQKAHNTIAQLVKEHQAELIAIGNGTASRETEQIVKTVIDEHQLDAKSIVVNEAGASVYSASELASSELSDLDVSLRGAVSIARRLQDPLSELVKVDPKAIGVGQYQHDVNQNELENSLNKVTEDCVNAVGVDVNTASPAILAHIAGLNKNVAQQIVNYRRQYGAFKNREELKQVPRFGTKTFEQSAGFLRIKDGNEPLDATGVHPESYDLVYRLLAQANKTLTEVLGNEQLINSLGDTNSFSQLSGALNELTKPAHDPRGDFKTAKFHQDVNDIATLKVGMVLEGVVTNVTDFGCFVDIGVHQDGLVHISELSDDFVDKPNKLVKPQDIVKVRVILVDEARKRISLSMKAGKKAPANKPKKTKTHHTKATTQKMGSLGALLQQAGIKTNTPS